MERTIPSRGKSESRRSRNTSGQDFLRRVLDLAIASIGLLFLLPFFAVLAARIRRDSPGPPFYRGDRVGRNGKVFKILKFRTMYEDDESYAGPRITAHGDQRITPLGQWLRDTKLNELPQLWNVLRGHMSLVGPRPEDPEVIQQWPEDQRSLILSVRPGITSPASIVYRDEESQLSSENVLDDYLRSVLPSKLRLDSLYVQNRTFLTDLDILFTTLYVLIPRARQVPIPESRLFWGPLSFFVNRLGVWFVVDFLVSLLSVALVGSIWRSIEVLDIGWNWAPLLALVIAIAFSISNFLFDDHTVYWRKASPREALRLVRSTAIAVLVLWLADTYIFVQLSVPEGLFIVAGLTAAVGFIGTRYRERILTGLAWRWLRLRDAGMGVGEPVLIVGAGELGEFAAWLVRKSDLGKAFTVIGMVDDDPSKQKMHFDGIKVLGTTGEIAQIAARYEPGLILFAISSIEERERNRILKSCKKTGVRIVMVPDILNAMDQAFHTAASKPDGHVDSSTSTGADLAAWVDETGRLLDGGDLDAVRRQLAELKHRLADGGEPD